MTLRKGDIKIIIIGIIAFSVFLLFMWYYAKRVENRRKTNAGYSKTIKIWIEPTRSGKYITYTFQINGRIVKDQGKSFRDAKCITWECLQKPYKVMYDTLDPENSYLMDFYEE